ncbi:hypothetical protein [Ralstonia solanacearum]|uniref:hypothetical protein n=1 Tax=Ralstonia solanacearum TaxID=305 RepID=UPI0001D96D51|nr:hypothetical protein [Ralstonia solanacearum]CBJ35435.1 hypothethical protein [Ralstonia solanacearum PSI07]
MTPQEIVGSKEFMRAAIASMAFSGGGSSAMRPPGGGSGPRLATTESEFVPVPPVSQVVKNKFTGDAFEAERFKEFQGRMVASAQQIAVRRESGTKTRLDMIGRDSKGKIACQECKASDTAPP